MSYFYVYILYSEKVDRYYVGFTSNLEERLLEHNSASGNRWTQNKGPWKLLYFEEFEEETDARKREIVIKKKKRRSYLEWLLENGSGSSVG
jgi:putative endonuclease